MFRLSNYSLDRDNPVAAPAKAQAPRARSSRFLKGPIPLPWLTDAAKLPGKALHVGVVLWFLAGLRKTNEVALSPSRSREFGIGRHSGYRAIRQLETARLITVDRHRGRAPIVTILEKHGGE